MAEGPGECQDRSEGASAEHGDGGDRGEETAAAGIGEEGKDTDFVESLPVKVKYRVLALKKLQTRAAHLESKFLKEFHDIERKFAEMYQPLLEKRQETNGNEEGMVHEYVDEDDGYEDCYYDYDDDDEEEEEDESTGATGGEESNEEDPKGIPDFWLTVLKNVEALTPLIKKYDEPILKLLTDIKVKLSEPGEPLSFTLEFHFKPNEYFKNELLTKTYVLKSKLACYDPHPYRGTAIEYATGCDIDWNEGKNVTLRTIRKKQRHRIWGTVRTVTEDFPKDSFFNFFSPHGINLNGGDENDDFLLGHNLRTYIIPRSVLFFSGDALESQQEGVVREVNDEIYDKIIYDDWMAAIEEVKACCKNLEALVEDIDR
ncbi:Nucleosome assembly protein 1-like 2 [Lemmus lemmus]